MYVTDLTTAGKVKRIVWDYLGKVLLLLTFLYLFICSLDFLSNAFRLIGGRHQLLIFVTFLCYDKESVYTYVNIQHEGVLFSH